MKNTLYFLLIFLVSCAGHSGENRQKEKNILNYSKLLRLTECNDYFVATILNPADTNKVLARYVFLETGAEMPQGYEDAEVFRIPLQKIVVYSSVHSGVIDELGKIEKIKGVVDGIYFKSPYIVENLNNGKIIDLGLSSSVSYEKMLNLGSDGIFISIFDGMDQSLFDKPGLKFIKFVDNMEETPLGRAEWIRFIGRLIGEKEKSDSVFNSVRRKYISHKNKVAKIGHKPRILVENMYQGVWYVSGGNSYMAHMIMDAGGDYIWKNDKSVGSLNLSFEEVLKEGRDADFWLLRIFGKDLTKENLLAEDKRYRFFRAVDNGGVYYANTEKVNIFEEFPYHPEKLLEDYINIFHPNVLENKKLHYFRQMDK